MVLSCTRCLQEDNFWTIRQGDGKVKTIHLNPKIYKKYGYKVGDEKIIQKYIKNIQMV
jgi:hypothetical protein